MPIKKLLVTLSTALIAVSPAQANNYPSRPVTLVVPYTAGGAFDVLARLTADAVGKQLGANIVIENKPGAGGTLGGRFVSQAKPDGYTLLMSGTGAISIAPAVYKNLDAVQLAPVVQLTASPFVLTISGRFQGKTVADLITLLQQAPGAYNYASTGNGTVVHLFGEFFKQQTQTDVAHIPFSGGAQAMTALLQGDVLYSITNIPNVLGQIQSGQIKALATTGARRSTAFAHVPTFAESGVPGFEHLQGWIGIFAPPGTPKPILEKINASYTQAMQDPALLARLHAQGDTVHTQPLQAFVQFVQQSNAAWKTIATNIGVSID